MEKETKIKVLIVEPTKKPRVAEIENTLAAEQKIVEGYIEACYPFADEIAIICNEEGKLSGMQGNRRLGKDIIAGPFFIVGEDGDEFRSLTDEETKENLKRFAEPEDISQEEVENAMSAGIMFFG